MEPRVWLSELRKAQGFTKTQVASMVGISRPVYSRIETGERNPSVKTAQKIAEALQFSWRIFFEEISTR